MKSMKINETGILTWTRFNNYGSVLQAYALQKYIQKLNLDPIFIDYIPSVNKNRIIIHFKNPKTIFSKIKNRVLIKNKKYILNENVKTKKFNEFRKKHFKYTKPFDKHNISEVNNNFKLFICGSDQIWSPIVYDSNYFFKFLNNDKIKVAYAPSFGTESIEDPTISLEMKNLLPNFDYLSTREVTGVSIINQLTGLDSTLVVDPTLLLSREEWGELSIKPNKNHSKILLCYFLGDNSEHWKDVEFIAKELDLIIYVIPTTPDFKKIEKYNILEGIGIEEFLGYIEAAEFICTDSFHGTVFSIIYNKKFRVYRRFQKKSKKNQNSRIINILKIVNGLSYLYESQPSKLPINNNLDLAQLDNLILSSKLYLNRAISYENKENI